MVIVLTFEDSDNYHETSRIATAGHGIKNKTQKLCEQLSPPS